VNRFAPKANAQTEEEKQHLLENPIVGIKVD
jgi:hypothetical protein